MFWEPPDLMSNKSKRKKDMATPLNVAEEKKNEKTHMRNGERLRRRPTRKRAIPTDGDEVGEAKTPDSNNREDALVISI